MDKATVLKQIKEALSSSNSKDENIMSRVKSLLIENDFKSSDLISGFEVWELNYTFEGPFFTHAVDNDGNYIEKYILELNISMIEDELASLISVLDKELGPKITYADLIKANELKHSIDEITEDLNYKKKILAEARDYNKD